MASSYPSWLLPSLVISLATALTFRSKVLNSTVILYSLYWLVEFHLHHPTGPFVDIYVFTQVVFSQACRTINYLLLKDPEKDFVRAHRTSQNEQSS